MFSTRRRGRPRAAVAGRPKLRIAFAGDFLSGQTEAWLMAHGFDELHRHTDALTWKFLPRSTDDHEIAPRDLEGRDALILRGQHVRRQTLTTEVARTLTVVARNGSGYDKIDLDACTAAEVLVFNVPEAVTHGTAFGAFVLMAGIARKLVALDRIVREGRWDDRHDYIGDELRYKTLGIVGLGRIGQEVARLVGPLEMRLLAYGPRLTPERARGVDAACVPLDTLLAEADFVCLTCPLTDETRGLIGARELALMKRTAYLVNVARGEIVDQTALAAALGAGGIAGAGLDVFAEEPPAPTDPLLGLENVILNPHFVGYTHDVVRQSAGGTIRGLAAIAAGLIPSHVLNPEVLDRPGFATKLARFRG